MSRLASITNQNATYASYKYLGAGRFVEEDYAAPGVRLSYDPDGDNSFSALDRFGRVVDQLWERYGQTPVVLDHYCYTYDRAGNRTSRTNELNHDFDELYDYDGIDRLISSTRADDFDQSWALDGLGNFAEFDDDGESQTLTANAVNEITGITGGWISPSYDAAGNMISGPKPGDETTRVHYRYDAWNRLVAVRADDFGEPGDLIAEYQYDGVNRRVEKIVAGTSHAYYYFNHDWQLLEERFVDEQDDLLASNQYVWSARYIDAPLVRFHDGNGNGDLLDVDDNIRYYTGDGNYNVTATIDAATGEVVNRYVYTAYGKATLYDDDWTNPSAPTTDGPLYCGYFFDAESGLYQVRNRFYDAGLSTFITRDPIEYESRDCNLYRYCWDNPVLHTDPSGQVAPVVIVGAIGAPVIVCAWIYRCDPPGSYDWLTRTEKGALGRIRDEMVQKLSNCKSSPRAAAIAAAIKNCPVSGKFEKGRSSDGNDGTSLTYDGGFACPTKVILSNDFFGRSKSSQYLTLIKECYQRAVLRDFDDTGMSDNRQRDYYNSVADCLGVPKV